MISYLVSRAIDVAISSPIGQFLGRDQSLIVVLILDVLVSALPRDNMAMFPVGDVDRIEVVAG